MTSDGTLGAGTPAQAPPAAMPAQAPDAATLARAMEHLAGLEFDLSRPHRNCFIVGAPRSGTTILHQSLCYASELGYVDNLVARFHWLPELGVSIARDIGYERHWSGSSRFGRTDHISEPHEFGRFWQRHLGHETASMIQGESDGRHLGPLKAALDRITSVGGRPYLHKVFSLIWRLAEFHTELAPDSRWVWIRREVAPVALSLLKLRLARGSLHEWQSLVPRSALDHDDPYEQVVAQVIGVERCIAEQLAALPSESHLTLDYATLCADYREQLARVGDFLGTDLDAERLAQASGSIRAGDAGRAAPAGIDIERLHAVVRAFGH